jgi:MFS family permease
MSATTVGVDRDAVYRKISWRLLPFVLACYVVNYLDRVSIGYAKLQFMQEMHMNEAVFGMITAVFFFGYIAFEVPSNLILMRIGAPATLTRVMVLWGAVIVSMMFARNEYWLYVQRFLLGSFEAGFFPGVLLYLSFWFPNHRRGRATSLFLVGIPLSGLVGGAISGAVMEGMDGLLGIRGWRWLFLVDGLPAILLGLAAMFVLTDKPANAGFLTEAEKLVVVEDMEADRRARTTAASTTVMDTLRNPKVWLMVVVYFTMAFLNTNQIWFPTLLREVGARSITEAGNILAGVWIFAAAFVLLVCRNSDRVGDRKWHILATGMLATAAYLALPLAAGNLWATAVLVAVAAASGLRGVHGVLDHSAGVPGGSGCGDGHRHDQRAGPVRRADRSGGGWLGVPRNRQHLYRLHRGRRNDLFRHAAGGVRHPAHAPSQAGGLDRECRRMRGRRGSGDCGCI